MKSGSRSLVSLKCLLFCFFGGLGCLFPYLPLHMRRVGLTLDEAHIVSIVAPLVAVLGPLLAGPLADRLGSTSARNNGCALRAMIALSMVLSAVSYLLLLAIPTVERFDARPPAVSFKCGPGGAEILQERCMEKSSCYHWPEEKVGPILLTDCLYDCEGSKYEGSNFEGTTLPFDDSDDNVPMEVDMEDEVNDRPKRQSHQMTLADDKDPPHICSRDSEGRVSCHVYTESSRVVSINASLLQVTNPSAPRQEWCRYPIGGEMWCTIPQTLLEPIGHEQCQVVCSLSAPYTSPGSVLAQSQCQRIVGDPTITFWTYLLVRAVADIFPATAVALLNTAIIIATRETSFGQSDVGRQLAFGSLGLAIFAPLVGFLTHMNLIYPSPNPAYLLAFIGFAMLMVVSALLMLFAKSMPLGTPEWWWSSRGTTSGGRKRYGGELAALLSILVLLGVFCSALDSYSPWHLTQLRATSYFIGLTFTVGALPAIPLLWYSEKVVDYCGHSNLLITAFTFYIIRYTGLSFFTHVWLTLLCDAVELFTLSIMWVTAILYVRQLMPRHLTATGQGAAVIAHFCVGRSLGALLAALLTGWSDKLAVVYRWGAVSAAVVATLYFVLYYCCLTPRCIHPSNSRQSPIVQGGMPTNGSYTPLQVYNNGRKDQKEQAKY